MNGAATAAPFGQEDDSFRNALAQHVRRARRIEGRNLLQRTVKVRRIRFSGESKEE